MAKRKPCAALADVINAPSPFGPGGPYALMPLADLHPLLVLPMQRLTDDAADDDNIIWDFAESFGLNRRAVAAAVKAYRHASRTIAVTSENPPVHAGGRFPSRNFRPWCGLSRRAGQGGVATSAVRFQIEGELNMKKAILVGLAILAVSTSGALAKKASKPKAPAAAPVATTTPMAPAPFMIGQVSPQDREMYEKSQRESGMKKK